MPLLRRPFLLLTAALAASAAAQPAPLDEILDQIRQKTGSPAIAAAAVQDGKIVALGVRGVRELGKPEAAELGDQWLIGSCTKPMTRHLLARLTAKHPELAPDKTLGELLPDVAMRTEYKAATLADLMNHTAGLQPYTRITPKLTPIIFEAPGATAAEKRAKFVAHLLNEAPAGERGKFLYSNAAYALLGYLAERKTGQTWEQLIAQEVFGPLGMKGATIGFAAGAKKPQGHRRTPDGFQASDGGPIPTGILSPAGGVCLPVEDFARFALGALAAKGEAEGNVMAGGQGSYTAAFALWPSRNFGVVVCTNAGEGDPICDEVIRAVRKTFAPDIPEAGGSGRRLGVVLKGESDGPGGAVRIAIDSVIPGGLADKAGLKAGDLLISINGQPVQDRGPGTPPPGLRDPGAKIVVSRMGKEVMVVMP